MKLSSVEELTSNVSVGSLFVAGVLLGVDAFVDLRDFTGYLIGLPVWEPLAAIPAFFVSYVAGLIVIRLSALAFARRRGDSCEALAERLIIVASQPESVVAYFEKTSREVELLQGVVPALACIAAGLAIKALEAAPDIGGRLQGGRVIFLAAAFTLLLLNVPTLFLIKDGQRQLRALLRALATKK